MVMNFDMMEQSIGSKPPKQDALFDEMIEQREQLKALIKQSSDKKNRGGRFFKYASDKSPSLEVTFKDFLGLDPELVKNAIIVTGTSTDVDVKYPNWIECNLKGDKEALECAISNNDGRHDVIGNVIGVSNFKNALSTPMDDAIKIESSKTSMRCAAEREKVLFCIGY